MQKYLNNCTMRHTGPLFVHASGRYLIRRDVSDVTKCLLQSAGVDPSLYSSHSYRIGAATSAAAAAGMPDHLIKTLGRWRNSAYQRYIHSSPDLLCQATARIAGAR